MAVKLTCRLAAQRSEIARLVRENGGEYEGDMTKKITHLISFRTDGAKYKAAKNWGLRIVALEWLQDSLDRGMILDETLYDPVLPEQKRGIGAWDKSKPRRNSLGKRSREDSDADLDICKRRLRRTASTKLSSGNDSMWADISGASLIPQVERSGIWDQTEDDTKVDAKVLETMSAQKHGIRTIDVPKPPPTIQGIFGACRFFLEDFVPKKYEVLSNHLISNGAEISESMESFLDLPQGYSVKLFRIIPHTTLVPEGYTPPKSETEIETVTEMWVERCLYNKKFVEPAEHVIGRPFPKFPIEGFQDIIISSAAFSGIDLLHLQKTVGLIGARYSEDFTAQSSLLLTKSVEFVRKDKLDHANLWNTPLVNATWLWDCITAGKKLPTYKYHLRHIKGPAGPTPPGDAFRKEKPPRARSEISRATSKSGSADVVPQRKPDRSRSELIRPESRSSHLSKPDATSRRDTSAFDSDNPNIAVKTEVDSQNLNSNTTDSNSTFENPEKSEPLSEISHNPSPTRVLPAASAPSDLHRVPPPREDLTNNIANLLAKTKKAVQPPPSDPGEARKRGGNRILGRVSSNLSTTSRASSVDSTATHGNAVEYPSYSNGSGRAVPDASMEMFLDNGHNRNALKDIDSQPPATQLQYDDPESKEYKERVQARLSGESFDQRRVMVPKQRAVTLGDLSAQVDPKPKTRRTRNAPGFR